MKHTKTITDESQFVSKLIFEDDTSIVESVAYSYDNRRVVCFSVQSGCPVGCVFCGTGKRFIRNLTTDEIILQIRTSMDLIGEADKIQFMAMSMGEPMLNWDPLAQAMFEIMKEYPDAHFIVSTVGINDTEVWDDINAWGTDVPNFGLQISLHNHDDDRRKELLGNYRKLLPVLNLMIIANRWKKRTGKKVYWNYICTGLETEQDADYVYNIVGGHHLTCSVLCDTKNKTKGAIGPATRFATMVKEAGEHKAKDLEISIFDPAGQDTIGGGCGQLLYVQEKLNIGR